MLLQTMAQEDARTKFESPLRALTRSECSTDPRTIRCQLGLGEPRCDEVLWQLAIEQESRCGSGEPGRGLDAVAALTGEPEESRRIGVESGDEGSIGREGAQARPRRANVTQLEALSIGRSHRWLGQRRSRRGGRHKGATVFRRPAR